MTRSPLELPAELPSRMRQEITDLSAEFGPLLVSAAADGVVVVALTVRGVEVRLVVEVTRYPERPPSILCAGSWRHPNLRSDGEVRGLKCQEEWNRTFGLGQAVRELNARLVEVPSAR